MSALNVEAQYEQQVLVLSLPCTCYRTSNELQMQSQSAAVGCCPDCREDAAHNQIRVLMSFSRQGYQLHILPGMARGGIGAAANPLSHSAQVHGVLDDQGVVRHLLLAHWLQEGSRG